MRGWGELSPGRRNSTCEPRGKEDIVLEYSEKMGRRDSGK